jgi:hypothetical protein
MLGLMSIEAWRKEEPALYAGKNYKSLGTGMNTWV